MKRISLTIITLISLTISAFANETPYNVILPAGTTIILETTEAFKSDRASIGQLVRCKVKADVVVDGKVVIRTGATALARVSKIQKNTFNSPEIISLTPTSVRASDGQQLAIYGTEQSIKGQFPNQGMEVSPYILLMGTITNTYTIKI